MDFQSAMETFAEAWVAANTKPLSDASSTQPPGLGPRPCKSPSCTPPHQPLARSPSAGPPPPPPATSVRLQESPPPKENSYEGNKANCGKSLPVHCIVESVTALEEASWRRKAHIETDSYVIIPVNTAFHELVTVALHRLNYPAYLFNAAKGCLIIKNWKPLSFDKISDTSMNTVGDILGELTTVATLKIQIFKPRPSVLSEVKDKLLKLLLTQSHGLLLSTGCPLDEVTLSYLCRSPPISPGSQPMPPEPTEECRRKFEQWWAMQLTNQQAAHSHVIPHHSPAVSRYSPVENHSSSKLMDRPSSMVEGVHPALQTVSNQYPTQKTRMRTSFDPELELPKLQRWFADNQHPSRQQIQHYVKELNSLESRRGRKPLDVNNVVYWFKNARAAQKRAELRQTPGGLMGLNGYSSASHSPPISGGRGPLMSPHSVNAHHMYNLQEQTSDASENDVGVTSDAEDDEELPASLPEEVPLSLTTNDKSPHTPPLDGIKQEPPDAHNNNNTISSKEVDDLSDEDDEDDEDIDERKEDHGSFRTPSPTDMIVARQPSSGPLAGFPLVPNSMFSHSIMYMSHYIPGLGHNIPNNSSSSSQGMNLSAIDERRKRNRTFIDPVTEVPRLEQWFTINTHPSHNLILKYTEELNRMPYRQKFPRLESKNVQFWFKNRRAKCKRLKMSLYDGPQSTPPLSHPHMGYGGNRE